jgi:hypothetical protein
MISVAIDPIEHYHFGSNPLASVAFLLDLGYSAKALRLSDGATTALPKEEFIGAINDHVGGATRYELLFRAS